MCWRQAIRSCRDNFTTLYKSISYELIALDLRIDSQSGHFAVFGRAGQYGVIFNAVSAELRLIQLDLDINSRRQLQLHQCINRLVGRINDVHEAFMRANFILITGVLVHMR